MDSNIEWKCTKNVHVILNNTHTLAIDKRACSILAMIRSISELFWSGVGAHVTVDDSVFAVVLWMPLSDDSPVMLLLLCDMMPVIPLVAVVYLLAGSSREDVWEVTVDCICEGRLDGLVLTADFSSNCNSSHLTFSNAACFRSFNKSFGKLKFDYIQHARIIKVRTEASNQKPKWNLGKEKNRNVKLIHQQFFNSFFWLFK